jgi:hypothetical protein
MYVLYKRGRLRRVSQEKEVKVEYAVVLHLIAVDLCKLCLLSYGCCCRCRAVLMSHHDAKLGIKLCTIGHG